MEKINDYFEKGIYAQVFFAEYNLQIWKTIANESEFLNTQSKEVKDLFAYIQSSSVTNFILNTSKLFDNESNKYDTRCILSFLTLLENNSGKFPSIDETLSTIDLLKKYNAPPELINSVTIKDPSAFPEAFSKYYQEKYNLSDIKSKINSVKTIRDKIIAHNELTQDDYKVEIEEVNSLLTFPTEIVSIYGMAYHSMMFSRSIKDQAIFQTYFINAAIERLK